uniref:Uncharacterized protein n=1 Tax=Leptobrachium leishanense TaxID=445787 RepID=A0A8C5QHK8_9ANUR
MALANVRAGLTCSICTNIYTDPVTLTCGHSFCQECIKVTWDKCEENEYFCPECRHRFWNRPEPKRNMRLYNIAASFHSTPAECTGSKIPCTYCISHPVPAAKTCLLCEASLCEDHLRVHSKSAEHVLTEPTTSIGNRKCSVHKKVLRYYCCEDAACICVSCSLAGEHRGHKVETLTEASEKKKKKLRNILKKLTSQRVEAEKRVQSLEEHRRQVRGKSAGVTERVTALIRDIREQLEALEKRLLSEISRQEEQVSLRVSDLIRQLEIKKEELSRKMGDIEELCDMTDPLTVLQGRESDRADYCGGQKQTDFSHVNNDEEGDVTSTPPRVEEGDGDDHIEENKDEEDDGQDNMDKVQEPNSYSLVIGHENYYQQDEGRGILDTDIYDVNFTEEDVALILMIFQNGLANILHGIKTQCCALELSDAVFCLNVSPNISLNLTTASNDVAISGDLKTISWSDLNQGLPETAERFEYPQVLSTESFSFGRHFWEVEGSESGAWRLGMAYGSAERRGKFSMMGDNNKSWALRKWDDEYVILHDNTIIYLMQKPSCNRLGLYLNCEAGRLSFYELCDPIRHLHTFTATFTEPLHVGICSSENTWILVMAAALLRTELTCPICMDIYTDPVTLTCGHNYCRLCITRTWDNQEEREYSCPECRHKFRAGWRAQGTPGGDSE